MDLGIVPLGETLYFADLTKNTSGSPTAPTGTVTYKIYSADLSTVLASGSMSQINSETGFYGSSVVCSTGFAAGGRYILKTSWTVSSTGGGTLFTFQVS